MTDLIEATAPPLVRLIGGEPITLAELDLYDVADLLRAERAAARGRVLADCASIGATPGETYQELQAFNERRWSDPEWIALANTLDGHLAILERSVERTHGGRGRALVGLIRWHPADRMRVVAHVAGLELDAAAEADEGGDPENPPTGHPAAPTT